MKFLFVCLIALFFSPLIFASESPLIVFKVVGGANKKVRIMRPVEGKFFPQIPPEDTLNANGELKIPNTETVSGPFLFSYKKNYRLYVMPGRSYKVTIDPANKENPVSVEAPEPEGQLALLNLSWDFSQTLGLRLFRQDSVFANNKQNVLHSIDSCLQPFEQLYAQHKISKPLYAYAKSCIKSYYGSVLATTLILPMTKMVYQKDSAGYDAAKLKQVEDNWRDILKVADVMDPVAMATDTYQEYFYFYNTFYLCYHLYQLKGNKITRGVDRSDVPFQSISQYVTKEPLREYWLAATLKTLIDEARFQQFIPDLYNKFTSRYPHSKYIPYLSKGIETVRQFYAASKKEFTASQQFVQQYDSIVSVEELLSRFKGKTIYIDIWASWCGPCKAQFSFKDELDPFLKSKGMEVLYISLDRTDAEQKWKDMIKYYNLEGYHIKASEQLVRDIYKVFSNGKGISIPHYAVCKDGKIILPSAKAPGDKEVLYKQIESVL